MSLADGMAWENEFGYKDCNTIAQHHKETVDEVLYIIDYALNALRSFSHDDNFMCPNGSLWTYDEVREFLNKNLK